MILDTLIVGDTLDFLTTVEDYPPADGWTLKYRLVPRVSGTAITITAATEGTDYRVQESPTTTAAWTAGEYTWNSWVEKSGARYTVDQGLITLEVNPATITAHDGRSHARKVLDAIDAVIESRATLDQMEYAINGRSLKRTPIGDLLKLRQHYKTQVDSEVKAAKMAAGIHPGGKIQFRF